MGSLGCYLADYYGGVGPEVVRMDNLEISNYLLVGWRERLLCPTHIFGPKPSWLTWSVHVRVKLSSYLELLRGLSLGRIG